MDRPRSALSLAMKRPVVSVIIPTYNNAGLLPETLDGIRRQAFADLEIVVVDDGSTDATAEVVRKVDPAIVYHHQANRGPAAARNQGVRLARGQYLAFCDHDDVWTAGHLDALLHCFASFPEAALCFDNAELFGDGEPRPYLAPALSRRLHHERIGAGFLLWNYPVASMSVVMVARESFDRAGGLSESVGIMDDYHFYLRLAARAEIRHVEFVGCKKRIAPSNLSMASNLKQMNVRYLEDLRDNHPEVVRAIGSLRYKLRLARKYFKLGRYHAENGDSQLAAEMYRRAFAANRFNPRYLYHAARTRVR